MAVYATTGPVNKRVRFFDGQFLQDQDFVDEQSYHLDRERRQSRLLRITGIAEGLAVTSVAAYQVSVAGGTAVDERGRQLVLAADLTLKLPESQFKGKQGVVVRLVYREAETDPAQIGGRSERRWDESPMVAAVADGALAVAPDGAPAEWDGPSVVLAKIGLDANGKVTIDGTATDRVRLGTRLEIRSETTTTAGWFEAIRLGRSEHSAITHPGGGLLFGLHSDRRFYFADTATGVPNYRMIIRADTGNVGIGVDPTERLHVSGGKLRLDSNQQVVFADGDITNNLKLQLWTGYGLGINGGTLFYAADGRHSWRDSAGTNERMALTTGAGGALSVLGTGTSTFAGPLQLRRDKAEQLSGSAYFLELYQDEWSPAKMADVHPAIRFRHHNHFETTLETRPSAFHFLANANRSDYADLWSRKLFTRGLNVGSFGTGSVGTETSRALVDIQDAKRTDTHPTAVKGLYVTADLGEASGGIEFRHSNATQGIGFGFNSIYAAGANADQHLNLMPKGSGKVGIGVTNPSCKLTVRSGSDHLQLRREANETTGGSLMFLDLFQDDVATPKVPEVNPAIRFHHGNRFWHRIEAQKSGFHFKEGNLGFHSYVDIKAAAVNASSINVQGGGGNNVDLVVNGRLRSDNNEGGMWVASDRFVGGLNTDQIGFFNNGAWRLTVAKDGAVGIGGTLGTDGHLGVGTRTPENPEGWSRVLDLYGKYNANLTVRSDNIEARVMVHDSFWGGQPGMIVGTKNKHALNLATNATSWLTINSGGQVITKGHLFADGGITMRWGGTWFNIQNYGAFNSIGWQAGSGPSDARLKTGLRPIGDALGKVLRLRGVHFRWGEAGLDHLTRDADAVSAGPNASEEEHLRARAAARDEARAALSGDHVGLLAQDLEPVVPELVHEDANGYKHIRYQHLTALLVEAIKEQQAQIRDLSASMATMRSVT